LQSPQATQYDSLHVCSEYATFKAQSETDRADIVAQNVDSEDREELLSLQQRLESKIRVSTDYLVKSTSG